MSRKPTTTPETNYSALPGVKPGAGIESPTFRPIGPVPSDEGRDWMRMREAILLLRTVMPKRHQSEQWLLDNVRAGLVPITCRLLTYERHGGGSERTRYEWPGAEARLAEQIDQAMRHVLAGMNVSGVTCDMSWLDVTGPYAVDARMFDTHVDRAAIVAVVSPLGEPAAAPPRKPFNKDTPYPQLAEWYCARRDAAPPGGYTRKEDEAAAQSVGIGRDTWRALRKDHAPASWSQTVPKDRRA